MGKHEIDQKSSVSFKFIRSVCEMFIYTALYVMSFSFMIILRGVQSSNHQYWWSARSSTTTISSFGGSATSVGEDHEARDHSSHNLRTPPRVAPKTYSKKSRSGDEMETDGR
jgi:hypothetical protein